MVYHDGEFLIYDSNRGLRADVLTKENLDDITDLFWDSVVKCYPTTKMLIPTAKEIEPADEVPLNHFYKVFENAEKQKDLFLRANKRVREEDVPVIFEIANNIKQRTEQMSIYGDITSFLAEDDEATQLAYSEQKAVTELEYVCPNVTLFQKSPEDKLHIHLPDDSYIVSNDAKVPSMTSVSRPYRSPLYKMYGIDSIMNSAASLRKKLIEQVSAIYREGGFNVPSVDELYSSFYMEERTFVFGDPENNLLDIQPNEQDYYNNLLAFIRHHINLFNKESMKGATRSEIEERNVNDFNTCNLPSRLEDYLYDLLDAITEHHYSHTGQTMFRDEGNDDYADKEDDSDSVDDGDGAKRTKEPSVGFVSVKVLTSGANAVDALHGYIQLSGKDSGASVWAEAIVKLLRWGKFKPTALYVGENNPNEIDLGVFRVTTIAVDLAKMEKIVYEDGRSHFIDEKITVQYIQQKVGYDIDAVFTVAEDFRLEDGGIHRVRTLITIQDLIREYVSGNKFVDGIDFDGMQFFVDINEDSIIRTQVSLSALSAKTYIPSYVVDLGLKYEIGQIKGMAHALINRSALVEYLPSDGVDFAEYIAGRTRGERANALYGCWIKAFDDSCSEIGCTDLEDYINTYYTTIYPKFAQFCSSMDVSAEKVYEKTGSNYFVGLNEANPESNDDEDISWAYEDADTPAESVETKKEESGDMYPVTKKDVSQLTFCRLFKSPIKRDGDRVPVNLTNNKLIGGYYADKERSLIIFASLNDGVNIQQQGTKVMSYTDALTYLFNGALRATGVGKDLAPTTEFISETTARDLYLAVMGG